jgi:S-adenosylmethionine hydrolase
LTFATFGRSKKSILKQKKSLRHILMAIITLTSDSGYKDFYTAAIKAHLLNAIPSAQIVDISHQIAKFNIIEAAFILKNSFHLFPLGSIHIIGVDSVAGINKRFLAAFYQGHYFICNDNGLLSLIFTKAAESMIEIKVEDDFHEAFISPETYVFVPIAAQIAAGVKLESLGEKTTSMLNKTTSTFIIKEDMIMGNVAYIDSYGNAISNIPKSAVYAKITSRSFEINLKSVRLTQLSNKYTDVAEGEALVLFNSLNLLEIALNKGNASQLLAIRNNDTINILFP